LPEFKVLVVSANERLIAALSHLLQRHAALRYVGSASSVRRALAQLGADPPDIFVADSPPADFGEVLAWRDIRAGSRRLLMLTNYLHEGDLVRSVFAGASAIVLAPEARGGRLLETITRVAAGESLLPEATMARLQAVALSEAASPLDAAGRRVLSLLLQGKDDSEIASETGASATTVRNQLARALQALI
jgi:DNA-binding NarL/FixJ family response regulator